MQSGADILAKFPHSCSKGDNAAEYWWEFPSRNPFHYGMLVLAITNRKDCHPIVDCEENIQDLENCSKFIFREPYGLYIVTEKIHNFLSYGHKNENKGIIGLFPTLQEAIIFVQQRHQIIHQKRVIITEIPTLVPRNCC